LGFLYERFSSLLRNEACQFRNQQSRTVVEWRPWPGNATFASANASASPQTVTATGITLTGTTAGNYTLGANTTATTTAKITPAPTMTAVVSSLNPSYFGNLVTFTATVTNTATGATPTGTLVLTIDGYAEMATISGSGNTITATYSTATLPAVTSPHAVKATYTNSDGNFGSSGPASFMQTVSKAPTVSSVTVTPLYYNSADSSTSSTNPAPANCKGVNNACQQYSDLVTLTATLTPDMINGLSPATSVTFWVGTQNMGTVNPVTSDSGGTLTWTLPNVPLLEPSTPNGQMAPGNHTVTATFGGINPNLTVMNPTTTLTITQEDAAITYTGQEYFSSTNSTMSVPVTYTLQDATATGVSGSIYDPYPGDITKATAALTLTGISTSYSQTFNPTAIAVSGETGSNGLPSTATLACTFTGVPVGATYSLSAYPGSNSYYAFTTGDTGMVSIVTAMGGTGFITGGGHQTAAYLATAGPPGSNKYTTAGLLQPAPGMKMNFGFETKYQKSGKLQGGVNLIIRSQCLTIAISGYTPKPIPGTNTCVYQVQVPQGLLTSLTETMTLAPPYAELVGSAMIYDVTWPTPVQVGSKVTLQLQMFDVGDPGPGANVDPLAIQLTDNTYGLWFSNNWNGKQTVITTTAPVIQGGDLQVH
jgi:hypothetical protein